MRNRFLPVLIVSNRMHEYAGRLEEKGITTTVHERVTPESLAFVGRCFADIDIRVEDFNHQLILLANAQNVAEIFVYYDQESRSSSELTDLVTFCCEFKKVRAFKVLPDEQSINARQKAASLSKRHLEVITCLIDGLTSDDEIAKRLGISVETVKTHLRLIAKRLDVSGAIGDSGARARIMNFALKYLPDQFSV